MRKPLILFLCILLLCILPFSVYAHPGRTNSDGGHWDYESGNYHYHHGYPEHDHYDMDGDGYADCPYDFDDQTGANSGSQSSGNSDSSDLRYPQPTHPPVKYEPEPIIETVTEEIIVKETPKWAIWLMWGLSGLSIFLFLVSRSRKKIIATQSKTISDLEAGNEALRIESVEKQLRISELNDSEQMWKNKASQAIQRADGMVVLLELENKELCTRVNNLEKEKERMYQFIPFTKTHPTPSETEPLIIPEDIYFIDGTIPVKGEVTPSSPYGDFTVFVSKFGRKYHYKPYCGSTYSLEPIHVYEAKEKYESCIRCIYGSKKNHDYNIPDWYRRVKKLAKSIQLPPK